jgi:hypothetical protein
MAAASGVPASVVERISAAVPVVDVAAMNTANLDRLKQVKPEPRTPTVYDLNAATLVEDHDSGWLDRLVGA